MVRRYKRRRRKKKTLLYISLLSFLLCIGTFITYMLQTYNPGKLTITAPFGLGSYEFDRASLSEDEINIAWKMYVQLTTRKAAIPFDEQNDIVTEVYDSWYELFKTTREYLIEFKATDLEGNDNAQEIVRLSLDVLNKGLRPHLTVWQGKYRKWYDKELQKQQSEDLTPQQIQQKYPQYAELIADMKVVNTELNKYALELKKFSHEKPPNFSTRTITWFKGVAEFFK